MVSTDQVQLVISTIGKPARDQCLCQPGTPTSLDQHPDEYLDGNQGYAAQYQRREQSSQIVDRRGIALLDRVENFPVPDVDSILETDVQTNQREETNGDWPCQTVTTTAPIAARTDPEAL
ncbi:hypothetical protein D3C73_643830 [compost metagenome]